MIILSEDVIVVSDTVMKEFCRVGYSTQETQILFERFKKITLFVHATPSQVRRAKDIATKRDLPAGDALHALIARDTKATLVSFDNHFACLKDITHWRTPREIISQES
ncbi:MAG: PIN domain-containing protein [Candidatus Woesearchaeota archaeon]|nr:PIN domain-containing protein [Candidatus Woesearchaeota archaeon]